jgi:hypothetical protein
VPPSESTGAHIREIAGPRPEDLVDAAKRLVTRRGDLLRIVGVTSATDPDAALYEAGGLLPGPNATLAGPSFDEWLDENVAVAGG